jgi:hypothetical protein
MEKRESQVGATTKLKIDKHNRDTNNAGPLQKACSVCRPCTVFDFHTADIFLVPHSFSSSPAKPASKGKATNPNKEKEGTWNEQNDLGQHRHKKGAFKNRQPMARYLTPATFC